MRRKFVGKAPDAADPRGLCITPSMQSTICGPREPSPHYLRPVAPMLVSLPPALAMTSCIRFGPQSAQLEQSTVSSSNSMAMERSLACPDGQPHLLGQVDLSLVAFLRLCCPPIMGMVEETSWWEFYFVSFFSSRVGEGEENDGGGGGGGGGQAERRRCGHRQTESCNGPVHPTRPDQPQQA